MVLNLNLFEYQAPNILGLILILTIERQRRE